MLAGHRQEQHEGGAHAPIHARDYECAVPDLVCRNVVVGRKRNGVLGRAIEFCVDVYFVVCCPLSALS